MTVSIQRRIWRALLLSMVFLVWRVSPVLAHATSHTVEPGETLSAIAQQHGAELDTLRQINGLDDADFVWVGQQLALPAAATSSAAPATYEDPTAAVSGRDEAPGGSPAAATLATAEPRSGILQPPLDGLQFGPRAQVMAETTDTPSPQAATGTLEHIVQPGDSLGRIAAQHDTTAQAISAANQLADPNLIVSGQRLVIPNQEGPQGATAAVQPAAAYHVHTEFPTETDKWIDVDLSEQRVVAYAGRTPVKDFIISSGLPGTPTVTGTYRIWAKVALQDMSGGNRAAGDYYYLEDVPWVQYFFEEYAFHGTYWHNNFGQPMSRGCINMRIEDAKWLFDWADPVADGEAWTFSSDAQPGTLVMIHE